MGTERHSETLRSSTKRSLAVNPDGSMNKAAISLKTNLHMVLVSMLPLCYEESIVKGFLQALNYMIGENHYISSLQGGAAQTIVDK